MICAFCPYLGFAKDRLSRWLSIQTLNNFGGINGNIFNSGTDQLLSKLVDSKKKKLPTKSGSLETTA